jgi:hypothetical protein
MWGFPGTADRAKSSAIFPEYHMYECSFFQVAMSPFFKDAPAAARLFEVFILNAK